MRSRKTGDLNATAEDGHLTAAHCHLANIAYRVGRTIVGDPEASALLTRDYRAPYVV